MIAGALMASPFSAVTTRAADLAFVTSQNGDAVSVIDLNTRQIVATTPVPGAPAPVAYDPMAGLAYVIAADSGLLTVLDETGAITGTSALGEGAFGIAADGAGGLFVTDWFAGRLMRIDADLRPLWSVPTGRAPAGVAISADGTMVATADRDDDRVSLFDAESGRLIRRVATAGAHPFAVTFHDGRLWTADVMGDTVSVIDPFDGRLVGAVPTGSHPYGVAFAGGRGFVTNQYDATVTVFDAASLQVIETLPCGDYPEGIAALPDGSGVVLANWESDTVQIIDAATLTITGEIAVPSGPRAFGLFTGRQVPP